MMNTANISNSENVFLLGRHYEKDGFTHLDFSGASFKVTFIGKHLEVEYEATNTNDNVNRPYISILVNDKLVKKIGLFKESGKLVLLDSKKEKEFTVEVIKTSECPVSHVGYKNLTTDGEFKAQNEENKLKILIFGDSVTCGYGIDAKHITDGFFTFEENYLKSYAYRISKLLDAYVVSICSGGFPIYKSPYSNAYKIDNIPDLFRKASFDINSTLKSAPNWDNENFVPDIVIINLGANDGAYLRLTDNGVCREEKLAQMKEKLDEFIKSIKEEFKATKVLVMSNLFYLENDIDKVLNKVARDNNAYRFISTADDVKGKRPACHPSNKMHKYGAKELAKFIRGTML